MHCVPKHLRHVAEIEFPKIKIVITENVYTEIHRYIYNDKCG